MANLNKVHEACLLDEKHKRRKLIEEVRQVAIDIEFEGRGDTAILAQELDYRGIQPLYYSKWLEKDDFGGDHSSRLREFIKHHLPDLWPHGAKATVESVPRSCLCPKCHAARECDRARVLSPDAPLNNQAVSKKFVSKAHVVNQGTAGQRPEHRRLDRSTR